MEAIIGHLKSDFRVARNYLKSKVGDSTSLMMATSCMELKEMADGHFLALFPRGKDTYMWLNY